MSDPDTSPHLGLPYLLPGQAQKHVTHNEALRLLDAIVHLAVEDRDRPAPPASAEEGQRHIVSPAAGGDWAGQGGRIAVRQDGAWTFLAPRAGWRARVLSEDLDLVHDGTTWRDGTASGLRAATLGLNAAADAANRLTVAAPATLLTHDGEGHQLKINKAGPSRTASLLFQSDWSGRAELGLAGSDRFALKVSADGAVWSEVLSADPATGRLHLPAGAGIDGPISGTAVTQGPADATPDRLVRSQDAVLRGSILGTVALAGGQPAGAVIERGSGAGGEYIRWADGTQICLSPVFTAHVTTATGAIFRSGSFTWTFPVPFAADMPLAVLPSNGNALFTHWMVARPVDALSAQIAFFAPASVNSRTGSAVAIGRWA
ncbi:DUF2793 domain-containing protein [Rubellimicrobium sp. CFH 75288]|uniref:DUF2793 domain-containing protein n=1 Tax=Rubellimicrobium sp. CFH 75288 TaxID=2697034 RepID=UPI001412E6F8|nr:DUF2793 domain-containing protein [Rubellimicrobium sp. CFH 75288]NAZ35656.1 DUF2793 domain-containing protein [Rubellimicrobium sp. CFH 75288]